jgi:hypothetical protein
MSPLPILRLNEDRQIRQHSYDRPRRPATLPLSDRGSRASAGAYAHRAGNPDRPALRWAHRTGAIAARRGRRVGLRAPAHPALCSTRGARAWTEEIRGVELPSC